MHVCLCVWCRQMCFGAHRDQKWVLDPLELEFQEVVRCWSALTWVLGTELGSSA